MFLRPKSNSIREKRLAMNLSQHKLSKMAGLGGSAVYRMEEEKHLIHPLRAKAVADVLGCSLEEIFEEEKEELSKVSEP